MLVYTSFREFVKERDPGSVVLVPANLLDLAAATLDLLQLSKQDGESREARVAEAPFYVLKVDPFITKREEERSKTRFGFSLSFLRILTPERSRENEAAKVREQDPLMPDGARIMDMEDRIRRVLRDARGAIADKSVLLYVRSFRPKVVRALCNIRTIETPEGGVSTYVALPVSLDPAAFEAEVRAIKAVADSGIKPSFLLGLDPLPVRELVDGGLRERPLPRYLIARMIENRLPLVDPALKRRLADLAAGELVRLVLLNKDEPMASEDPVYAMYLGAARSGDPERISEAYDLLLKRSQDPESAYSLSTLYLNALSSAISQELLTGIRAVDLESYFSKSLPRKLDRAAREKFQESRRVLARLAKALGSSDKTAEVVGRLGIVLPPAGLRETRDFEIGDIVRIRLKDDEPGDTFSLF